MGCWSENCAISGMEVPYNDDIYLAIVAPSEYGRETELVIPPVLGKYDDYGGLVPAEDAPYWGIKKGMGWQPRDERRGWPVYMNAKVFDHLATLTPWIGDDTKSIGDIVDAKIEKGREVLMRLAELPKGEDGKVDWTASYKLEQEFEEAIDRSRELIADFYEIKSHLIRSANLEQAEAMLVYLRRAMIFQMAQRELRRRFLARIHGPQHGGASALIPFYEFVLNLAKEVEAERRAEWGEDEDEE